MEDGPRLLIIKMSSLGDVVHTLPAVTDALCAMPNLKIDWLVEASFSEIPTWHPGVTRVIPVQLRRWRKHPIEAYFAPARRAAWSLLKRTPYDFVIDAQGLIKSAWMTRHAQGPKHGFDWHSAREPLASLAYTHRHSVPFGTHAVNRVRQLFSLALGYTMPESQADFGLRLPLECFTQQAKPLCSSQPLERPLYERPYLIFFHGTTWATKEWPVASWRKLIALAEQQGFTVLLPWGNSGEQARAHALAEGHACATVLPSLTLKALAYLIQRAHGVVTVDTGLGHIAGALSVPVVSLYGATDPKLTGIQGRYQHTLVSSFSCAPCKKKRCHWNQTLPPCYESLKPERVWAHLEQLWITRSLVERS